MGAQGFYSWWDSGLAKMGTDVLEPQLNAALKEDQSIQSTYITGYTLDVGDPEGRGFILGPRLRYATDDNLWEFTAALMWFGSYTSSIDSSLALTLTGIPLMSGSIAFPVNTELEIEHKDIDVRCRRALGELFSVFAGYKYQSYETNFEADYNINASSYFTIDASLDFSFKAVLHMPYAGAGILFNASDRFRIGADIALGLIIGGKPRAN